MNPINWRVIALQILILLALVFGAVAWLQQPEGALVWLTGMLTIPVAWAVVVLFGAMPPPDRPQARRTMFNSLLGAGLLIAGALGVSAMAVLGTVSEEWTTRYGMVTLALILVIVGNGLPKKPETGCGTTRSLAIQRLLGWTFVVTGLLLALLWLTLPMSEHIAWWVTAAIYAGMIGVPVIGVWRIVRQRGTAT